MGQRLQLQTLLEAILGSRNVYFQPPSNLIMSYPCIVYSMDQARTQFANNQPYNFDVRYQLTHIHRKPDTLVFEKLIRLPKCVFARQFVADDLYHDVFNLYF